MQPLLTFLLMITDKSPSSKTTMIITKTKGFSSRLFANCKIDTDTLLSCLIKCENVDVYILSYNFAMLQSCICWNFKNNSLWHF